jgi:hypothetical protein
MSSMIFQSRSNDMDFSRLNACIRLAICRGMRFQKANMAVICPESMAAPEGELGATGIIPPPSRLDAAQILLPSFGV